jgi:hypothetical protein
VKSNYSKKTVVTSVSESESEPEPEPEPSSTNRSQKIYTILEILCVLFWFLLDGFWLLEWKFLTCFFSVIAILTAFVMFRFIKKERVLVLVACADTSWLILNILWAIGDFTRIPQATISAKIFFAIGCAFCFVAFCVSEAGERLQFLILSRLRILKFFQRTRMI